jgi:hypothetical protein
MPVEPVRSVVGKVKASAPEVCAAEILDGSGDALAPREVLLHRRVVRISRDRIEVRRPGSLVIFPVFGVAITVFLLFTLVQWAGSLPFWTLPLLLISAVLALPISGLGLVYTVFGANVVADGDGQSVSWKQGFLGMGVGTTDLVPFWKIREFVVEDAGRAIRQPDNAQPAHAFAQWEITLVKKNGTRLRVGGFAVPRAYEEQGLDRVMDVAEAFSTLSGAPIRGPIW